ncbi:putative uncharacterized protein DDB_G0294196, partial [Homalodisca vitripennis]|uniref:putative uncharacterized protein DDB_G0294196 n=1 Tax=Homalodisca vitripennis TaxID=197043 RepID=UPI001EEA3D5A
MAASAEPQAQPPTQNNTPTAQPAARLPEDLKAGIEQFLSQLTHHAWNPSPTNPSPTEVNEPPYPPPPHPWRSMTPFYPVMTVKNASILRQLLTQPQQQQPLKSEQDRQQQPSTTPSQSSIQQQQQQSSSRT